MGLLYYVSYFALLAGFAFVTLSLASGLLYVSELIEEHSKLAKLVGQRTIYVIIVLHFLFYLTDKLSLLHILFSVLCHVVYLQNFSNTWPLISLTSISFLASCALVIADHFIWFFYFSRITTEARHLRAYRGVRSEVPGFAEIASFFGICVWLAPLFLFLSLSANDNALPVTTIEPASPSVGSMPIQTGGGRVSLIRSMFAFFSFDGLPRMRQNQRKDTSEGIIAPHSPISTLSPLPYTPSAIRSNSYPAAPPRSPGPRVQEVDFHLIPPINSGFKLDIPPGKRQAPVRRQTSGPGSVGLGLRRSTTPGLDE